MPPTISIHIHEAENALYLSLDGELDQRSFLSVSQALSGRKLVRPIKVDLKRVRYADSTGLRALVLMQRQAREAGQEFWLLSPSEAVQRIFLTTGLAQVFRVLAEDPDPPA